MTRLPLSPILRITGFCRRQSHITTDLRNSRQSSSEASQLLRADLRHGAGAENGGPVSGIVEAGDASSSDRNTPKKRGRKPLDKPREVKKSRGKVTLQPGEVLPDVAVGDLPPLHMWRKYFPLERGSNNRPAIRNPETAALLADAFVPEGSKDKIIIEASPGPGQLTRALLRLPKERVKKIFVIEPGKSFLKYLEPLEKSDPRVKIYRNHGQDWAVYSQLKEHGAFDLISKVGWDEVHPQLQFIMHMNSSVDGEQLLSQFFRCMPDRHWLFHYGRVPMNLILSTRMWERVTGFEGSATRCKLSVIAQATAQFEECVPGEVLQPYNQHFHPESLYNLVPSPGRSVLEPRKIGTPQLAIKVLPLKNQHIAPGDLDVWDFALRKLFVLKATTVRACLIGNALGPGSRNLIPKLTDSSRSPETLEILKKSPRDLNLNEWNILIEEFKKWPFRPDDLGIESCFEGSNENR